MVYLCAVCGKCLSVHMWKLFGESVFMDRGDREEMRMAAEETTILSIYMVFSLFFYY